MKKILFLIMIIMGVLLVVPAALHAQDDDADTESVDTDVPEVPLDYMGDSECLVCHRNMRGMQDNAHGRALTEPDDEGAILGDFSIGDDVRMMAFDGDGEARPFTTDDIFYVIGAGRYAQNYVVRTNDGLVVAPAMWHVETNEWLPYGDDPLDWVQNCAGCHTTGLDVATGEWVDNGVSCESCHGPGSYHVELADFLPRRATGDDVQEVRDAILVSADAQTCGQCHSQGVASDGLHPFAIDYLPGGDLFADYDLVAPDDEDHWWVSGHGKSPNMRFNEWGGSGHASALTSLLESENADDSCLACHSTDYAWQENLIMLYDAGDWDGSEPISLTLETAQFGVTCGSCHNPHIEVASAAPADDEGEGESEAVEAVGFSGNFFLRDDANNLCLACHSDPDLTDGMHYPIQQMFEGQAVVDEVIPLASAHFAEVSGPDCATCHMPRVPVGSFTQASHTMSIVSPTVATDIPFEDSCSVCHGEDVDAVGMAQLITDIQATTDERLVVIQAAMTDDAPEWLVQTVTFVEQDSSRGIHNPNYSNALLQAAETELGLNNVPDLVMGDGSTATMPDDTAATTALTVEATETPSGFTMQSIAIMVISVVLMLGAAWVFLVVQREDAA